MSFHFNAVKDIVCFRLPLFFIKICNLSLKPYMSHIYTRKFNLCLEPTYWMYWICSGSWKVDHVSQLFNGDLSPTIYTSFCIDKSVDLQIHCLSMLNDVSKYFYCLCQNVSSIHKRLQCVSGSSVKYSLWLYCTWCSFVQTSRQNESYVYINLKRTCSEKLEQNHTYELWLD